MNCRGCHEKQEFLKQRRDVFRTRCPKHKSFFRQAGYRILLRRPVKKYALMRY